MTLKELMELLESSKGKRKQEKELTAQEIIDNAEKQ